jgi:hypothetical protein
MGRKPAAKEEGMSEVSDSGTGGSMDFGTRDHEMTGGAAPETAQDAVGRAGELARDVRQRATEEVESRIADQKYRAADTLGSVAQSLRAASAQIPENEGVSRYMAQAAKQVDNLASFLNNREVTELFDEVEDFARRQPAVFVGGAFALGVLGARFLKSSRRNVGYDPYGGRGSGMDERYYTGQDAVSRPNAPGYAAPSQRESGFGTAGSGVGSDRSTGDLGTGGAWGSTASPGTSATGSGVGGSSSMSGGARGAGAADETTRGTNLGERSSTDPDSPRGY